MTNARAPVPSQARVGGERAQADTGAGRPYDAAFDRYYGRYGIERVGYRGFLSAVWMLWKMNRNAKEMRLNTKAEIILPLRWFR